LRDLQALAALQPTTERLSLCGSTWKRLALLEARAEDKKAWLADLKMALEQYGKAEALAAEHNDPQLFFPGLQRMSIELVLHIGKPDWQFDEAASLRVRRSLQAQHERAPDFFSNADLIGIDVCDAIVARQLAARVDAISAGYAELHRRLRRPAEWRSVFEQLNFVLDAYASVAATAEVKAARALVEQLRRYAG
jgi:hypothetical protein